MPREPSPSNAMSSWFTCWSTTRAHQLPVHRRPFPLQRWQRVLQKSLCWCKIFYCFFCQLLKCSEQISTQACVTPPAVGRQARCGPEATYWQQKRRTALEGGSSMPATLTAQTSHPALSAQPGSSPDLELFGAPCDDYIEVHSSSAVQITTGW